MDDQTRAIVAALEERAGYRFHNPALALQSLTHSSARDPSHPCNERLEFLGDSIIGHVVSEYLYLNFPEREEGDLSTMKSVIVSAKTLSVRARELGLDSLVVLGRGLARKKALPQSILCNTFEAVTAAIYLDGGADPVRDFILRNIQDTLNDIMTDQHEKNYKSLLQDHAQRALSMIPAYRVLREVGPDHKKSFEVVVEMGGRSFGPAWGHNKKEAEQNVARIALVDLNLLPSDELPPQYVPETAPPGEGAAS